MLCWSQAALILRWDSSLSFGGQCYCFFWILNGCILNCSCLFHRSCMSNFHPWMFRNVKPQSTSPTWMNWGPWNQFLLHLGIFLMEAAMFLGLHAGGFISDTPRWVAIKQSCQNNLCKSPLKAYNHRLLSFLGQRIPLCDNISSAFDQCIAEGGQPFGVDFDLLSVMPSGRTDSQFVSWHYCDRFLAWTGLIISLLQSII